MCPQVSLGSWANQVQKDQRDKKAMWVRTAFSIRFFPSFLPSFSKHLLSACCVPGPVLGAGETSVNKTESPAYIWVGEKDNTQ